MKITLKIIALFLAITASAQTVISYAEETGNLTELVMEQEMLLIDLLSQQSQVQTMAMPGEEKLMLLSDDAKKKLVIKNMIHYIRLIEGQKDLLDELRRQQFPDLDIQGILNGKHSPGI